MGKKGAEGRASRNARKKEARKKKKAASANRAAMGDNGFGSGFVGGYLPQIAPSGSSNVNKRKAGDQDLNLTVRLSANAKDGSDLEPGFLNIRGGHQKPFTAFNPSTINDHNAGEEYMTLVDASKGRWIDNKENGNDVTAEYDEPKYYGVDIFRAFGQRANNLDRRLHQAETPARDVRPQRSLLDVYSDHQELKLDGITVDTLNLAGQVAKQVALEATYEFLQKVGDP